MEQEKEENIKTMDLIELVAKAYEKQEELVF